MPSNLQQTQYHAFGLWFGSELHLPELIPAERERQPDVEIVIGDLAREWERFETHTSFYVVDGERIWFAVPRTAIYRISNGREIVVDPLEGADERAIRLYLLGSCMGALLMQRNTLPLHGSAVVVDGGAYAFVGESGAGKSTLAAAFSRAGFPLLSDDVIALSFESQTDGTPVPTVLPSYPQQKLWRESLEQLGMDEGGYSPLLHETSKFAIPAAASYCRERVPLKGIFELLPSEESGGVEIEPLYKLEKLSLIGTHTYRNFLVSLLGLQDWHFSQSAVLAGSAGTYRIRRPPAPFSAHEMVSRILHTIREGA